MSEPCNFELVFSGQTIPGADVQKVRSNAGKLFRADAQQLDKLFSGKPVVLKNNLDEITAENYITKLKSAGMVCQLRPMAGNDTSSTTAKEEQASAVEQKPQTQQQTAQPTPQSASQPTPAPAPAPQQTPQAANPQESAARSDDDWSLAPVGSDVNPHEPEAVPPMPDTSQLSLREQKGYLFDQDDTPPPPAPDTNHITLE